MPIACGAVNGQITNARALLDSASSTSFITKRPAQHLRFPCVCRSLKISGIAGVDTHLTSRGIVLFNITNLSHKTDQLPVEAVVLPKIKTELPVHHILNDGKWKHLKALRLADLRNGRNDVCVMDGDEESSFVLAHLHHVITEF